MKERRFMRRAIRERVVYMFLLHVVLCGTSIAAPIQIGFEKISKDLNVAQDPSAAAQIVLGAVTATLTEKHVSTSQLDPSYRLRLADNSFSTGDFSAWAFRIRNEALFANGRSVTAEDVAYSVSRCSVGNVHRIVKKIAVDDKTLFGDRSGRWVGFYLDKAKVASAELRNFPLLLASCPIFERRSSETFGEHFGIGTNLVSSGKYVIERFDNGKQIILKRIYTLGSEDGGSERIVLRSVGSASRGLTALRMGTIDVFFTDDPTVVMSSRNDDTLAVTRCFDRSVVYRKSLAFSCIPELDVTTLHYVL